MADRIVLDAVPDVFPHTPSSDTVKGAIVVLDEELVGVAQRKIAANTEGPLLVAGKVELPKATGTGTGWSYGKPVFKDGANHRLTAVAAAGNQFVGLGIKSSTDNDTVGSVMLNVGTAGAGVAGGRIVQATTTNKTLTAEQSGTVQTTVGATGTVTYTLPAAVVGLEFYVRVGASFECRLDPAGTETIALPSTGVQGAAGKYLVADLDGETVHIMCTKAGQWSVFGFTGTWTAES